MLKIEHLGIAVDNLEESIPIYEALLNTPCYKKELVASEGVMAAFFQVGPNKIELLEASNPDSPIAKFLATKGKGF
ncbi:MAG: methylmalonyl-CoA epimerase, partial [Flavobacteriia bacterium]|nr:methylmalonyl-CoA epimerase [Flavobacteriia bacterium]